MEALEDYKYIYPELSEEGQKKTQEIVDRFAKRLHDVFNQVMYEFTCNIGNEITSEDSWLDIRQKTKDALAGYPAERGYSGVNWIEVRKKILEENRDAIINDIIIDKEEEIARLNGVIDQINQYRRGNY